MIKNRNIAFYAPIKPPDHHIPSGDRLIAQNLVKTLDICGANHEIGSQLIAYSKKHDQEILKARKKAALEEADTLVEAYLKAPKEKQPELWLTYHPYCKAPDWIGPKVCAELDIPYVTVEAAKTGQGDETDPWAPWRQEAQEGICKADRHLVLKPSDRTYLQTLLKGDDRLYDFPPFIDAENMKLEVPNPLPLHWNSDVPVAITTGMMRKGKKLENFRKLAEALKCVEQPFNLIVVGGGPEEASVREQFSWLDEKRILWTGGIEHVDVLRWMRASDVFIWPGWKEPIGMVYLEAQLQELPIVAYESMGVPLVVKNRVCGLLAEEDNSRALGNNLETLLGDKNMRITMGQTARRSVLENHGIYSASRRLDLLLGELLV